MKRLLVLVAASSTLANSAVAVPVMTAFDPAVHGFNFANTFNNDFIPSVDWTTGGLCGGMCYAAMDHFNDGRRRLPQQWWRPATGSEMEEYIYSCQTTSTVRNLDRWAEVGHNPGGARDSEFFTWGIKDRIPELRRKIDAGTPAIIGLQGHDNGSHQVVVIGYDMGAYRGDGTGPIGDFKLICYDPNYPGRTTVIRPDPARKLFEYESPHARSGGRSDKLYRTWFVDTKYTAGRVRSGLPMNDFPRDGSVRGVLLEFQTGDDDLRGDKEAGARSFISARLRFRGAPELNVPNISRTARWIGGYGQTVFIPYPSGVSAGQLASLQITQTSTGGISRDNWTMKSLKVKEVGRRADGSSFENQIIDQGQNRFDGANPGLTMELDVPSASGRTREVLLDFGTGNDDLRGGNDNLDVIVDFTSGGSQTFTNVNRGVQWGNYSTNPITLRLSGDVTLDGPRQIRQIRLRTTSGGGVGGDNWTMDTCWVHLNINNRRVLYGLSGQHRFTGVTNSALVKPLKMIPTGQVQLLHLIFDSGGDDLRGGNDNLKVKVFTRGGGNPEFVNVNAGVTWPGEKRSNVTVWLPSAVSPEDVLRIELETNNNTNDNWDLKNLEVWARGAAEPVKMFEKANFRFSSVDYKLVLRRLRAR
ncbi:MAG: hypothetical protein WCK51_14590 [Armatimonadota bacterium]